MLIVGPARGTGPSDRIGDKIKYVSMYFQGEITHASATVSNVRYTAYLLIAKKYVYATSFDETQILDQDINGQYTVNSFRNMQYFKDYKIIRKVTGNVRGDNIAGDVPRHSFKMGVKFKTPLQIQYNGSANTTQLDNILYLYIVADSGTVAGNTGLLVNIDSRQYFID